MKNTFKVLMCILLVLCCVFGGLIACNKDTEESSSSSSGNNEEIEVLLIFDYSEYENVVWDEDFDEEMIVMAGARVGDFPKPKLAGHTFDGWYEDLEDSDTKLRKTTKYDGDETEITLYAKFKVASDDSGDDSGSGDYNCAKGLHNWEIITTPATCDKAGTKTKVCRLCHDEEPDAIYSSQNKALGHQWVEDGAIDDGGWEYVALARQRTCKREGCEHFESFQLENLTSQAKLNVQLDAGAWPGTAEWPANLTDNKWDTGPNGNGCAPKGGGPLTITFLYNKAVEIDQIAISCVGLGDEKFKIEVYLQYADENAFGDTAVHTGTIFSTNGTRETAYIIDRSHDDRKITGIKIVQQTTSNGSEYWREIAIARIPDEE